MRHQIFLRDHPSDQYFVSLLHNYWAAPVSADKPSGAEERIGHTLSAAANKEDKSSTGTVVNRHRIIPVIRYADVPLMVAACLNEAGYQAGGEAFGYLNQIRNRVGLGSRTATDIPDQAAFRLAVEHESVNDTILVIHRTGYDITRIFNL